MIKLFKQSKINSLQKKYDKLMKESYDLARSNPDQSQEKQLEAQAVKREIISQTL